MSNVQWFIRISSWLYHFSVANTNDDTVKMIGRLKSTRKANHKLCCCQNLVVSFVFFFSLVNFLPLLFCNFNWYCVFATLCSLVTNRHSLCTQPKRTHIPTGTLVQLDKRVAFFLFFLLFCSKVSLSLSLTHFCPPVPWLTSEKQTLTINN